MAATVLLDLVPTYQYSCTECGEALEVQQSFSDDPLTVCPACQGRLRKVYNAVGVVFKGSGFYRTDSRAGKGSNGSSSTSDSSDSSSSPKPYSASSSKESSGGSAPTTSGAASSAS
jgi:putative FmdB family regulatory protein